MTITACDIPVNCVGIFREERLLEVTEATYDQVLEVNLKAPMFLAGQVLFVDGGLTACQ